MEPNGPLTERLVLLQTGRPLAGLGVDRDKSATLKCLILRFVRKSRLNIHECSSMMHEAEGWPAVCVRVYQRALALALASALNHSSA